MEGIRTEKISNISRIINNIKKLFFSCIHKMVNITKETYEANGTEVITDKLGELWLNERHVQQQLRHKNYKQIRQRIQKMQI